MSVIARALASPQFPGGNGRTFLGWGGDYIGGAMPFRLPGEQDYQSTVGDGSGTALISAAVNWMARELTPVRHALLEHPRNDSGVPRTIRTHQVLDLLRQPTRDQRAPQGYYDGTTMRQAMAASWLTDGNVYRWKIRSVVGRVMQYWYLPHFCMEPIGVDGVFIDHYRYSAGGQTLKLSPNDVDHLRFGLDPTNPRKGMSPIRGVLRELYTDEEAARFSAALLHNIGFPGAVIVPGKDVEIDPEVGKEIRERFDERFTGDGRGRTIVLGANAEVKFLGWSPQELDLSSLRDVPEERVSAVVGIPAAVLGFGTGLQQVKVGATMRELRSMGWEGALIPFLEQLAENETAHLLPEFIAPGELSRYELSWDLSRVAALSDMQLRRAEVEATLVRSGIKKVDEARVKLGLPPVGGEDGGFKAQPGVGAPGAPLALSWGGEDGPDDDGDHAEALEASLDVADPAPTGPTHADRFADTHADSPLTLRELAVMEQVAKGRTNKAIADTLRTSERTVERVISRAMTKTGAPSRAALVAGRATAD